MKSHTNKAYLLILSSCILLGACGQTATDLRSTPKAAAAGEVYAIGEVGPGKGIVFITPSTVGNNTGLYFEAAPYADEVRAPWCTGAKKIGEPGTEIGAGAQNTATAAKHCTGNAIKIAADYENNGLSDWFLPSRDELNEMFVNRKYLDGYSTDYHWSSSESSGFYAWFQRFNTGINQDDKYGKYYSYQVRPVRSFKVPDFTKSN